jgi:OOP family OmpA-OmpF porin
LEIFDNQQKEGIVSTQFIKKKLWRSHFFGAIALGLMVASTLAQAEGWYGGVSYGQSKINDFNSVCSDLLSLLPGGAACSSDDTDNGWKIFAGSQFSQNAAVEFGYIDLGQGKFSVSGPGVGGSGSVETKGFNVDFVGMLPVTNEFGVIGKIGLFRWDVDFKVSGVGGAFSDSATGVDLTYGIGLKYDFTKTVGMRAEWERFKDVGDENKTGQGDLDLLSVGLVFKF